MKPFSFRLWVLRPAALRWCAGGWAAWERLQSRWCRSGRRIDTS